MASASSHVSPRANGGKDAIYQQFAEAGFTQFQIAGQTLKASGVPYFDFSTAFADEPESVYKDSCCHYNQRGIDDLAKKVGELLSTSL